MTKSDRPRKIFAVPYPKAIRIRDGRVETRGIAYETNRITVFAENESAIVLRVPGRSTWAGNFCQREYASPLLMVFKIIRRRKDGWIDVEPLIEWGVGRGGTAKPTL